MNTNARRFRPGNRIRNYRVMSRYTQKDLAYLLGVPRQTVSRWEVGERVPGANYAVGIGVALHRMADDIFYPYRREWVDTINRRAPALLKTKANVNANVNGKR